MMNMEGEHVLGKRGWRLSAAAGMLLVGLAACQQHPARQDDQGDVSSANDNGVATSTETPIGAIVGQTCTDAWRSHGHTTQREAKAFLTQCLAAQGVEGERLDPTRVRDLLKPAIQANSPLTSVVPVDIADFCPGYIRQNAEGRARFWRALLLAIVGPESDFRTTTSLWEEGELQQFSIGLLQLSFSDRGNHGCGFTNEADIADPTRNLACGVRIMTRLVSQNSAIGARSEDRWLGGARYWSVLRTTSDFRAGIVSSTSSLKVCQAD